jgi:hypothetical protein
MAPASLYAADQELDRASDPETNWFKGVAAGVHPSFTGGQVVEAFHDQWDLRIGIRWTCAANHKGVEQATGIVHLWSPTNPDYHLDLPCILNASVQPGNPVLQNVVVPWDERSDVHQWLRQGTSEDVRSAFIVEWAAGADPERETSPSGSGTTSRSPSHGLHTNHANVAPR